MFFHEFVLFLSWNKLNVYKFLWVEWFATEKEEAATHAVSLDSELLKDGILKEKELCSQPAYEALFVGILR